MSHSKCTDYGNYTVGIPIVRLQKAKGLTGAQVGGAKPKSMCLEGKMLASGRRAVEVARGDALNRRQNNQFLLFTLRADFFCLRRYAPPAVSRKYYVVSSA